MINERNLFKGKTMGGKWVCGSLVQTTAFIKSKPKQHTKTWIVTSAFGNGGWFNIRTRSYVIPETVGQYTGEKLNGEPLFNGDLLKVKLNEELFETHRISWGKCGWQWQRYGLLDILHEAEKVGNIHDGTKGGDDEISS